MSAALLVGGLSGIIALGVVFAPEAPPLETTSASPRPAPGPRPPDTPADPSDLGFTDARAVAPMDLLERAKTRALAWHREATLVSISASPVIAGKVDLTAGGRIEFVFGRPTGQAFGPGAPVRPRVFSIVVEAGSTVAQEAAARITRAATEPNCTPDEVASTVSAVGIAAGAPLELLYAFSTRHDRVAWRAQVPADASTARYVDGWTCTILVR